MKYYIEAFDKNDTQILGNLDGQGIIHANDFRRTKHYKALSTRMTLNNRVKYYNIVDRNDRIIERVNNATFIN